MLFDRPGTFCDMRREVRGLLDPAVGAAFRVGDGEFFKSRHLFLGT